MKKYVSPEINKLNLDTKDICNGSGLFTELYDIGLDPHVSDRNDW